MLGPRLRLRARLVLPLVGAALASCAEPHFDSVRWPAHDPDAPPRPQASSTAASVELQAAAMTWEAQAVSVALELTNTARVGLIVDPSAILLAWDGLEYPPGFESDAPAPVEVEPGEVERVELRYDLGRPLASPGARLLLRGLSRDGTALVVTPSLVLPPTPDRS